MQLAAISLLIFIFLIVFSLLGGRPGEQAAQVLRILFVIPIALFYLAGLGALITSVAALARQGERSWQVWLALLVGAFAGAVTLIEILGND